ncbi:hypothetical protein K0B96_02595 [Horticoccus luteus]|uniref:Uncharacterized protein n=1 Tax=Horticoccus luteus TaxID=2862869 RepID=A0A8F9XLZ5_9BACT|nr:hypothetical protein [Horticoccus luteus]QYM79524.1 hypothetical protein K0B96_02595 [Horticoccus luteus]
MTCFRSLALILMWAALSAGAMRGAEVRAVASPERSAPSEVRSAATVDHSPAAPVAQALTAVTGIAISPLLGTSAYGAYQWFRAKDDAARAKLPWFAQWYFFAPALLLVGACAAKDALGAIVPPGLKKPLDMLETVENKISGLIAAGAVVPILMMTAAQAGQSTPVAAGGGGASALAMVHFGAADGRWLLGAAAVAVAIVTFGFVWMASHAINVLILLSPWGAVDAALKSLRTGLMGLLALTAIINPWAGAALAVAIIVVAYFLAGWAFRLTTFGSAFCWDFFTLRRTRFHVADEANAMFAGGNLPEVPARTYGRLRREEDGSLVFAFKPWLVLPERRVPLPTNALYIGRGLFFSAIVTEEGRSYLLLPPRYRGHERAVLDVYKFVSVQDAGLRRAWSVLGELFGGAAAKTQIM